MLVAKRSVIAFVRTREIDPITIPKTSHRKTPEQKAEYMTREMALTSRVRKILMAWGKKEKVVSVPATRPKHSRSVNIIHRPLVNLINLYIISHTKKEGPEID